MFRELGEFAGRIMGQIVTPKASKHFEKFVEDLNAGNVPEVELYNDRSEIDYFGKDKKGNERVVLTTPMMDMIEDNRVAVGVDTSYYVTIKPNGEREITHIPPFKRIP